MRFGRQIFKNALPENTCLMLEHMSREEDYILAAKYLKSLAAEMNIHL